MKCIYISLFVRISSSPSPCVKVAALHKDVHHFPIITMLYSYFYSHTDQVKCHDVYPELQLVERKGIAVFVMTAFNVIFSQLENTDRPLRRMLDKSSGKNWTHCRISVSSFKCYCIVIYVTKPLGIGVNIGKRYGKGQNNAFEARKCQNNEI